MNRMIAPAFAAVLVALSSTAAVAQSSTSRIVMRIEGLTNGLNASAPKTADKDWLPVQSLSLDAVTEVAGSRPSIERIVVRKSADASSAEFLARWMTGGALPLVEIEFRKTTGSTESVVLRYELVNAVVLASRASVDPAQSSAVDQLELTFEELELTSNEVDSKGKILNSRVATFVAGPR